jgi:ATP-dependent Lhr-like helicase
MTEVLQRFAPATREWFTESFAEPTPAQAGAWEASHRTASQNSAGNGDDTAGHNAAGHVLVVAPTGSGKTLAAFLSSIDRLMHSLEHNTAHSPERNTAHSPAHHTAHNTAQDAAQGTRVLYISPLKALAVDVERNLTSPLVGITRVAARRGEPFREVTVGVRSGDTPPKQRRALIANPPDILITTPESLFLMLTSAARETLRHVDTVIIDEIHAVAGTKRGAHLALSLERLDAQLAAPAQRIGLSATVRPIDEVARFLCSTAPVQVVNPQSPNRLTMSVNVPVEDMTSLPAVAEENSAGQAAGHAGEAARAGMWPHVEEAILDVVDRNRSTIVFVNSRGLAERLTSRLNEAHAKRVASDDSGAADVEPVARAHHGSVSKDQRSVIEDDLKSGRLRCVVATSSLELGIDMGDVDTVVQVSTPPSVASGLQRVGRAGHHVGGLSQGVMFPTSRHDLLGSAVTAARMQAGQIERIDIPANPLDILAQQTVAATALEPIGVEEWFDQVRRAAPFSSLPRSAYEATLDLLSGRYPSDEFAELRPRLVWDRDAGTLTGRPGAQRLAVTSGGTIPDRGMFAVTIAAGAEESGPRKVGELDEEMVYESRINDVFALGATSWRIQEITHDRVIVTPAFGEPARLPFWHGEAVGRPFELGEAIGQFVREATSATPAAMRQRAASLGLNRQATDNLAAFLAEQRQATGQVPSDTVLVIERFRDEVGDWRVVLHSPYGRRVHAPWALAVAARIRERFGMDGSVVASDDGIVARLPDTGSEPPGAELFIFELDDLRQIVTDEVGGSALFASRFRECAARALLLPRRNPGSRAPLWQQRQRSAQLLDVARQYPTFPILLETARECLQDVYDLPGLTTLMQRIEQRQIDLAEVTTEKASPFAQNLLFGYVAAFLYEGDSPLAERRAAALALDPALLADLLGHTELRELLDPDVLARTEAELQRLAPDRKVKGLEGVADLLRILGPLTADEIAERVADGTADQVQAWAEQLQESRRAIAVQVAGQLRWAAIEDAGRLRDALGVVLPGRVPKAHLDTGRDPLADLVARFARTHGPFTTDDVGARFGLGRAVAQQTLARLAADGRLTEGEFSPHATGSEWVEPGVLRRLRTRSLAAARKQVEPVDPLAFARFLPSWQGVGGSLRGAEGVLAVIEQLAGASVPASAWESLVLPSRVRGYSPAMLDELAAAGEIVWTGAGSLPGNDGWVQIFPSDLVTATPQALEHGTTHAAILDAMASGGAYLYRQLTAMLADGPEQSPDDQAIMSALWDLVWSGHISNDTFTPIRLLVGKGGAHRTTRPAPRARLHGRRLPRGSLTGAGMLPTGAPRTSLRAATQGPPSVSGRWFAVHPATTTAANTTAASTAAANTALHVTRAELLLGRYGVVTRGSVMAEQTPGGFAAVYRVLRELEQTGACLRGYYIDTLGAAQFAAPATIDRLRATANRIDVEADEPSDEPAVVLAATDPANPYGAALGWPATDSKHRPARKAGSMVVLHDGLAVMYVERGGKKVLLFEPSPARLLAAARALADVVRQRRLSRLTIEQVNGQALASTDPAAQALSAALTEAGFEPTIKGMRIDA